LLSIMVFSMITATFFIGTVTQADLKASEPKSSAPIELTIIVTDQQMPAVINVTDDFLADPLGSGVSAVHVVSSGSDATSQLTNLEAALASGSTDYDVVGIDVVWTGFFADAGWIIPLDSYLEPNEMDNYVGGMVDACTYNGHVYAYPYFMNLGILFYRKDLMDLNGLTPANFTTWEGLNETANYILNNISGTLDNPNLVGYVGQFDNYEGGVCNFFEVAGSNGATDLVVGNTVNIYPNSELEAAMTFFQKLIPPQYTGVQGTPTSPNPYIIPRVGLVMDEGSSVTTWQQNNSIFMRQWTFGYGSSVDNGIVFGVAPLPHFEGATDPKTSVVGGAILTIPTSISSVQRAGAINLTRFLGQQLAQERQLLNASNFPALKSVYATPPAGYEWIANWTDQLDQTLSRPVEAQYPLISTAISNDFSNILSGGKTVTQALSDMQTNIEEILAGSPTVPAIPGYDLGLILCASISALGLIIVIRKRRN
jgi:multiple sugar transport system substrate-binding protein